MKVFNTALLLLLCGSSAYSEDTFDPFAAAQSPRLPSVARIENAPQKIVTTFTCFGSGNLEGKALDSRVKSIVISISQYHAARKRVPKGIEELFAFCKKRNLKLYDLVRLSPVEFEDGMFKYSAGYENGTLHLSHIAGHYFTLDMLEPTKAEQAADGKTPEASQPPR